MDGGEVDMRYGDVRLCYNREDRARRAILIVLGLIVDDYSWSRRRRRYGRHWT